ncbi:MAG: hypothetical protein WCH01_11595 [Methylococcaceae bacterium]
MNINIKRPYLLTSLVFWCAIFYFQNLGQVNKKKHTDIQTKTGYLQNLTHSKPQKTRQIYSLESSNKAIIEKNLYAKVEIIIDDFRFDKANNLLPIDNLADIALCDACKQRMQDEILYGDISLQQLEYLTNWLAASNNPDLAKLLVETANKVIDGKLDPQKYYIITEAIAHFNAPEVANYFTNYIIDNKELTFEMQNALSTSINSSQDRITSASNIVSRFNETTDTSVRDNLLSINHPEALVQINIQASEENNSELYNKTNELLKNNPSVYALDALLSMPQMKFGVTEEVNHIMEISYQLANSQFSGNRLDYIDSKLEQGAYSEQEKSIILDILTHSEDQIRSTEIIKKYSK